MATHSNQKVIKGYRKFGDIGIESILAKNREIAYVFFGDFGKFGDIAPPPVITSIHKPPIYGILYIIQLCLSLGM